jgi:hypothetical protein
MIAKFHFGVKDITDGAVEHLFIDNISSPDQKGITIGSSVAVVPFAVGLVEFRCRIDLLERPLVQPAVDFTKGIAGDLGGPGSLLESLFLGICSKNSAITGEK